MTTRIRLRHDEPEGAALHVITCFRGGAPIAAQRLRPGEEREVHLHAGNTLFISEEAET